MNCQFCFNELLKDQTIFVNNSYWQDFRCVDCHCNFTYEKKDFKLIKYVMYVDKYRLDCNILLSTFKLGIFDYEALAKYHNVYESNSIPHFTPQNALNKIKTILVFL